MSIGIRSSIWMLSMVALLASRRCSGAVTRRHPIARTTAAHRAWAVSVVAYRSARNTSRRLLERYQSPRKLAVISVHCPARIRPARDSHLPQHSPLLPPTASRFSQARHRPVPVPVHAHAATQTGGANWLQRCSNLARLHPSSIATRCPRRPSPAR
jgi:hypothetical protein